MSNAMMTVPTGNGPGAADDPGLEFEATDVTGTFLKLVRVSGPQRDLSIGEFAETLAANMGLPRGAWALRDDETGAYLSPDGRVRDEVKPGAHVTVTPKAHLGCDL
jgi:hypothetical protein